MKALLKFFLVFFKIGAFTFGGGLAMVPLIEREIVENNGWISREEFLDIIAVAQSMPGVIAVNMAIYLGYEIFGFWGAVAGSLGAIIPSFVIMIMAATFFLAYKENAVAKAFLKGIRPAIAVLIFSAAIRLGKVIEKNGFTAAIVLAAVMLISFAGVHPILAIVVSAVAGCLAYKKAGDGSGYDC